VDQFEFLNLRGVIPKSPRFYQRAEDLSGGTQHGSGDPSLRTRNGYAQDDAIDERRCLQKFGPTHYRSMVYLAEGGRSGDNRFQFVE
jgi:hypothetical protein